jgi:hypothetical protein
MQIAARQKDRTAPNQAISYLSFASPEVMQEIFCVSAAKSQQSAEHRVFPTNHLALIW